MAIEESETWQQAAGRLAREHLETATPNAWFDELYAAGARGDMALPWYRTEPFPEVADWLGRHRVKGGGRPGVVIGAGLGADAAYVARLGFDSTAFDLSQTAVELAAARVPEVRFEVADLLDLPDRWRQHFALVVEVYTVQAMPRSQRAAATAAVGSLVAPGGVLVVVQAVLETDEDPGEGPPWTLTEAEMRAFERDGLRLDELELLDPDRVPYRLWRAVLTRPASD